MEEAVRYGGEGMIDRPEYAPLSRERRLGLYVDASHMLESVFERADKADGVLQSFSADRSVFERELVIESDGVDVTMGDMILADVKTSQVTSWEWMRPQAVGMSAVVRHHVFREGPKEEEYIIIVHRTIPGIKHSFFAAYEFELYCGGVVHATVESNDVTCDGGDEGTTLTRSMTEYDVSLFTKEVTAILQDVAAAKSETTNLRLAEADGSY